MEKPKEVKNLESEYWNCDNKDKRKEISKKMKNKTRQWQAKVQRENSPNPKKKEKLVGPQIQNLEDENGSEEFDRENWPHIVTKYTGNKFTKRRETIKRQQRRIRTLVTRHVKWRRKGS